MAETFKWVIDILSDSYQKPAMSQKATAWESLLFTMLSARSKDDRTEISFRKLIAQYPSPAKLAQADIKEVESLISQLGLYRRKAKMAVSLAKMIISEYGGVVPNVVEELVKLPGVGRKTANCVLVYSFGKPAIPVDTHVHRIANRLGWVNTRSPRDTETALLKLLPEQHWLNINRLFVSFGQDICVPRTPHCYRCPVQKYCSYEKKILKKDSKKQAK